MTTKNWMPACAALAYGICAFGQQSSTVPAGDAQQAPAQQPAQQQPAPAPSPRAVKSPAAADVNDEIEGGGSVALFYWYGPSHPNMKTGKAAVNGANPADWTYPGDSKPMPGVIVSFPGGKNNAVRLYYFRIQGNGNANASKDLNLYGSDFPSGAYISSSYTLQSFKAQYDYLTWPFPVGDRSFRIKTLWEFQYTTIKSTFDAPLILDSTGTAFTPVFSSKSSSVIWPSFGIGLEKRFSKAVRWEGRASGFGWPHHGEIWDADTFLAFKGGKFEFLVGGKAFHFKTSPQKSEYIYGTWAGGYAGIRWYPRW